MGARSRIVTEMRFLACLMVALFLGAAYWVGVELAAALTAWLNSVGMGG